jgi:hypothetical protein
LSYSPSPRRGFEQNSTDSQNSSISSKPNAIDTLFEVDEDSFESRLRTPSGPFDKIIGSQVTTKEKENTSTDHNSPQQLSPPTKEPPRHSTIPTRSPFRRDLVKKTQDAINVASASVNQSLNAARQAKAESYRKKSKETAKIRQEWREDTLEAKSFYQEAEKNRRQMLSLQRQLSSKYSQGKARHEQVQRQVVLQSVDQESQFKSAVYRDHHQSLKEEEDERRRHSIAARSKIRANNRVGQDKMELERIEEEQAIFEERHQASVAHQTANRTAAMQRRKSFVFRNGDAHRIRETHARLESNRLQQEHESFELKWAGEKDAEAYQQQLARERRESLAGRNQAGRKQREEQEQQESAAQLSEHESYELNWAGERDADAYREKMAEERRKSFAFRNQEGSSQRAIVSQQRSEAQQAEHESYEFKWAGEKDAEVYERKLEQQRRESFANRNKDARRQREVQGQLHSEALHLEHESYELKWAGEKDAEVYERKMEQQRRESFANRNKDARRQREVEGQLHSEALHLEHESYELKWAGEKDAEAYQRKIERERRKSFAARNLDGRNQRERAAQMESKAMAEEHAGYELKWAGEKDAEAYQRQLEKERRESLARRNQERARHAQVMEELRTISREQETESLVLKWAGEEDAKKYLSKLEEERRKSFQLRGKESRHHREVEEELHGQELNQAHADEELRVADQKDVEGYQMECAERDRTSFEYRRKEARIQRIEEKEQHVQDQQADANNFQLDNLAHSDVEDYLKDCKDRRRMSLAFRAKEKRHHARWENKQAQKKIAERSRDVRGRLMDRRYVELAQQQERALIAIDAIRHAGCSFNPFSGVLE